MKKKYIKYILLTLSALTVSGIIAILLLWNGIILFNNPSEKEYPVRGIDVSAYQGDIDWKVLSSHDIDFVFIKATEGSSFVDKKFSYNFTEAQKTNLSVGAYHFFSFESPGKTQADNFIKNVIPFEGMLPPVIDFEFYGDFVDNPPEKTALLAELNDLIAEFETHYGISPIIYTTNKIYKMYLIGGYENYDIWIRDIIDEPELSGGRKWTFWQYTNREKLDGYKGPEKYIDMNVFNGTEEQFKNYSRYNRTEKIHIKTL